MRRLFIGSLPVGCAGNVPRYFWVPSPSRSAAPPAGPWRPLPARGAPCWSVAPPAGPWRPLLVRGAPCRSVAPPAGPRRPLPARGAPCRPAAPPAGPSRGGQAVRQAGQLLLAQLDLVLQLALLDDERRLHLHEVLVVREAVGRQVQRQDAVQGVLHPGQAAGQRQQEADHLVQVAHEHAELVDLVGPAELLHARLHLGAQRVVVQHVLLQALPRLAQDLQLLAQAVDKLLLRSGDQRTRVTS
ncbi:hypothetical protein EYF80_056491 [Liparis tanakae]|uniref:Uncharacterized protein n=1 Tax=Liparis tanakae TaxID=230148 RepID=A0A4Z2EX20_9TELE|nr:hypothetical protein EYF80_056491 [Liparis tanakae]